MTDMNIYSDNSFDHIYDKGALDALMSTNTNDTKVTLALSLSLSLSY